MTNSLSKPHPVLSERELEVIELVASGLTNQEISEKLAISKRTVDNHISNILTKTGTDNRVALVRWALQWGKVCLDNVNCCALPVALNSEPVALNNEPVALNNEPVALNNEPVALNNEPVALNNEPVALNNEPVALNNEGL
jgi:DNA-binding CsgD family transcriptional regulator